MSTRDYAATYHALLSTATHFRWIQYLRPLTLGCSGLRIDLTEDLPTDIPLPPGSIRSCGCVFVANPMPEDGEGAIVLMDALYLRLELQEGTWSCAPQFWP